MRLISGWTTKLPALTALFPQAKMICCVRNVAWVLDSIESLLRRNYLETSKIFNFEPGGTVYSRVAALASNIGMVGFALHALREAVFGEQADLLLLLRYETLTADPLGALARIYEFIGEPLYAHDRDQIQPCAEAIEFDKRLGTPGLHSVGSSVIQPTPQHPAHRPVQTLRSVFILAEPRRDARGNPARLILRAQRMHNDEAGSHPGKGCRATAEGRIKGRRNGGP
jgi:hypothetical protein